MTINSRSILAVLILIIAFVSVSCGSKKPRTRTTAVSKAMNEYRDNSWVGKRKSYAPKSSRVKKQSSSGWGSGSTNVAKSNNSSASRYQATPQRQQKQHYNSASVKQNGRSHALIIGNNDYRYLPRLKTAINDARAVERVLRQKYAFKTTVLVNAKRSDIIKSLSQYRNRLSDSENLLIYYAGHGWYDEGAKQGYWLPVDATKEDPSNWVSNTSITDAIRAMKSKHIMLVADSCYSGTLTRGLNIVNRQPGYFAKMQRKASRTVLTSGGMEPVSDEGSSGHSVFAKALLDALNENNGVMDGQQLFANIRRPVVLNSDQTPEYSDIRKAGHDGGDFFFVSSKTNQQRSRTRSPARNTPKKSNSGYSTSGW